MFVVITYTHTRYALFLARSKDNDSRELRFKKLKEKKRKEKKERKKETKIEINKITS